jgi:hypothetical protein
VAVSSDLCCIFCRRSHRLRRRIGRRHNAEPSRQSKPTQHSIGSACHRHGRTGKRTRWFRGLTLQINGSGFVSGSVASWNGANLTTTYVSGTELKAAVHASLAATGGSFAIAVANPDGQKSGSSEG